MKPKLTVAFTGHRPGKLGGYNSNNPIRVKINSRITEKLEALQEQYDLTVITGMALGIDQDAALICIQLGIPFIAAIPCLNHSKKWPSEAQAQYNEILQKAKEIVFVSKNEYTGDCMQKRNIWMVDHCNLLIAVWDGSGGGTANCVYYAQSKYVSIERIKP